MRRSEKRVRIPRFVMIYLLLVASSVKSLRELFLVFQHQRQILNSRQVKYLGEFEPVFKPFLPRFTFRLSCMLNDHFTINTEPITDSSASTQQQVFRPQPVQEERYPPFVFRLPLWMKCSSIFSTIPVSYSDLSRHHLKGNPSTTIF